MLGGFDEGGSRRSAALIAGLTVLALAAMATAIPPARLTPRATGVERGYLVSGASFSDMLAELLNRDGYTYMAIDLTRAQLRPGEVWRAQFDNASRIFPVWGWVDAREGVEQARKVATALPISGLLLYGAKPEEVEAVRAAKPGLRVVPVVNAGATWAGKGDAAVALPPERFLADAGQAKLPVLLAARLREAEIEDLLAKVPGDYLVCSIAILP
jgi:hypothetical protein